MYTCMHEVAVSTTPYHTHLEGKWLVFIKLNEEDGLPVMPSHGRHLVEPGRGGGRT